jgi:hypothetical protein
MYQEYIMKLLIMKFSPAPLLLHLRPTDIFHRILFLNNLNLLLFKQHIQLKNYQQGGWKQFPDLYDGTDRINGIFQAGYLVCRLRLLKNFRQGIWSAD